jgi:hypothetical protein
MRFRSTLVITFLVPILALLASVRAAPSGVEGLMLAQIGPCGILQTKSQGDPHRGQEYKIHL